MNHSNLLLRKKIHSFCKWLFLILLLENIALVTILLETSSHKVLFCVLVFSTALIMVSLALWKLVGIPLSELMGKIAQMHEQIPQQEKGKKQEDISLTQLLEDVLNYQEQLSSKEYSLRYLLKEAELGALQSQINPHFLFNTLESIRGCAYRQGLPELASITEAMSRLFRNSIQQGASLLSLKEELDNVNNYMVIQQFRFQEKFDFFVHIEGRDLLNFQIPNMVIQPIVENAIFHGLEEKVGKGCINLYISSTRKRLIIRVIDDGIGMSDGALDRIQKQLSTQLSVEGLDLDGRTYKGGIGLLNIHKRIQLYFGEQYGITIASTIDVGTEVEITLPIVLEE